MFSKTPPQKHHLCVKNDLSRTPRSLAPLSLAPENVRSLRTFSVKLPPYFCFTPHAAGPNFCCHHAHVTIYSRSNELCAHVCSISNNRSSSRTILTVAELEISLKMKSNIDDAPLEYANVETIATTATEDVSPAEQKKDCCGNPAGNPNESQVLFIRFAAVFCLIFGLTEIGLGSFVYDYLRNYKAGSWWSALVVVITGKSYGAGCRSIIEHIHKLLCELEFIWSHVI